MYHSSSEFQSFISLMYTLPCFFFIIFVLLIFVIIYFLLLYDFNILIKYMRTSHYSVELANLYIRGCVIILVYFTGIKDNIVNVIIVPCNVSIYMINILTFLKVLLGSDHRNWITESGS